MASYTLAKTHENRLILPYNISSEVLNKQLPA